MTEPTEPVAGVAATDPLAPRKPKPYRWLIKLAVAMVVLAIFVYVGRHFFDDLDKIRGAKPLGVLLIALIYIPTRLLTSETLRLGLKALGHTVGVYETFMVSVVNAYANLFIPRAGLGLPAVYMKLKHGVPIADFSGVQLVPMTVMQVTAIGIAGVISLGILRYGYGTPWHLPLLALFVGLGVASAAVVLLPVGVPARFQNRPAQFLRRLAEVYQRLGRSGHTIAWAMLLHTAIFVLRTIRIYAAFWALGAEPNFWGVFVGSLIADAAFFISITPSALGFREGGVMLAAPLMGVSTDLALAATILDRIVYSLVIIVIGQLGMWRLVGPVFKDRAAGSPAVGVS